MTEPAKESLLNECGAMTPRDWRNQKRFLLALFIWAVSFVGGSLLIKHGLLPDGPVSWAVALLPTAAGALVLVVFARFLREADELQRVVQLQALAIGYGGTFFAIAGYGMLERVGAPTADAGTFALVMALLYAAGVLFGRRRYR